MKGFLTRSEGKRYRSNSWRVSAIGVEFGGMMHSNKKHIAIQNGPVRPIFARSMELRPGPRDDVTALTL